MIVPMSVAIQRHPQCTHARLNVVEYLSYRFPVTVK